MNNTERITKETLKYNLTNLRQVTFEVTDDCNLRCKYCINMLMRKLLLLLFLLCISCFLMAQSYMSLETLLNMFPDFKIYEGTYRYTPTLLPSVDLSDSVVLDKSRLRVTYDAYIVTDTTTGVQYHDRMIVLIGEKWEKSYGDGNWMS